MRRIALILLLALAAGCTSTVIPTHVQPRVASFDGNDQNSGVIRFLPDGAALVTGHWLDRYHAMAAQFGNRFRPALDDNRGIGSRLSAVGADGVLREGWMATAEVVANFETMNRWRKESNPSGSSSP